MTRSIARVLVLMASLAVLVGWAAQGVYWLDLGESAVILRFGAMERIETLEGWRIHWPPPIEYHEIVNTSGLRTESFGTRPATTHSDVPVDLEERQIAEQMKRSAIQTSDSNIVNVEYELQYKVADAYSFAFGMANPGAILRDATEAAVREVIGSKPIDDVLSRGRGEIEQEAQRRLESLLSSYFQEIDHTSAFAVDKINLQKPRPPEAVREAFADVVSAAQDEKRSTAIAKGDAQEILERARAESAEIREQAEGYKLARIIESRGEAQRFESLLAEYRAAPEVTRRRLYLETMEEILPGVEKLVVERETVNLLPMLPTGGMRPGDAAR